MPDTETKHFLTSKIFISSCVGLISTIAMGILRAKGYDVIIGADAQLYATGVLMGLIGYWRTRETKQLRAKRPENNLTGPQAFNKGAKEAIEFMRRDK